MACGDLVSSGYHFNYEDADLAALPAVLAALERFPVAKFVPGHGPSGGREIVEEQARYHRVLAQIAAGAKSAEQARSAIRAAFPEHRLEFAIESALIRLRH